MKRVQITGMSATGKSTAVNAMAQLAYVMMSRRDLCRAAGRVASTALLLGCFGCWVMPAR
jgi:broad-specificity NMP kinase